MKALLVRVGADQSKKGGGWNGLVDRTTKEFIYAAVPEFNPREGFERPYSLLSPFLARWNAALPEWLANGHMHLDPDFGHLTYGDRNQRAKQIKSKVGKNDLLVFYAGLRSIQSQPRLVYAIIGLYVIDEIVPAADIPVSRWQENAHTRYGKGPDESDLVVRACQTNSGRLDRCLPIGEYRDNAYRVRRQLLETWGGLSVNDGYLQRSARLPEFKDAERFYKWFTNQGSKLVRRNN